MSVRVRFTRAATVERGKATRFYRRQGVSVAEAFDRDLKHTLPLPMERPLPGTRYESGTRRTLLTPFPYSVIYRVDQAVIHVVAVKHDRRDPACWKDRLHPAEPA